MGRYRHTNIEKSDKIFIQKIVMGNKIYFVYSFLAFASVFLYIDPYCTGLGRIIQTCFALLMMSFLLFYSRKYLKIKSFKKINNYCLFLICSILLTSFLNRNLVLGTYQVSSYTLGLLYAIIIFNSICFIEYSISHKKTNLMFQYFFKFCFITCIIVDCLIFSIGSLAPAYYFIGDKFTVSYLHFFLIALFVQNYSDDKHLKYKIKLLLLFVLTFFICKRVSCSTGQIGAAVFMLLLSTKRLRNIVSSNRSLFICIIIFTLISFAFEGLLNFSYFRDFIVDVLGKDDTMTGRTGIYLVLWNAVQVSPWFGWGQGNGMSFMGYYFSTPNAQNGFFNYVTDYGFIGVSSLLLFLNAVCSKVNVKAAYPLWSLIIVFIVLSSVEITFNLQFIVYIILLIPFIRTQTKLR